MHVGFFGSSITVNKGFPEPIRDENSYPRIVADHYNWTYDNNAIGGNPNLDIFHGVWNSIDQYDIMFVQWSILEWIQFYPSPDTIFAISNTKDNLIKLSKYIKIPVSKLTNAGDTIRILNHDYHNLIKLIDYANMLYYIATQKNKRIYFINYDTHWSEQMISFNPTGNLYSELDEYTKYLLDFENADDEYIIEHANKLKDKMNMLELSPWINCFSSLKDMTIDQGPLGHHQGLQSNRKYADMIITHIKEQDGN